jgi:hypothetical protein
MATVCPYCNIEVRDSAIEAEDGCCPECGALLGTDESMLGVLDDEFDDIDEIDDVFDEFDDDDNDDNAFSRSEFEDDIFDDEDDLDGELDEEFDDEFDDDEIADEDYFKK